MRKGVQMMGFYTFKPEFTVLDKEHDFFNKKQEWFLKKIENTENTEKWNINIDEIFYNKNEFEKYMNETKSTYLEKIWKNRISLFYTPRGNVMMCYDAYRMGFSYYSDQSKLSYEILNACAMNYVIQHRCLNFYIDEMTCPDFTKNPIAKNEIEDMKNAETKPSNHANKTRSGFTIQTIETKQNPNLKSIENNKQIQNKQNIQNKQTIELPKLKNKFIHVGKISNMNLLKKPMIPKKNILFEKNMKNMKSELMQLLEENATVQNQVLSYLDYKKMKNKEE
jgi:hypothetical protein